MFDVAFAAAVGACLDIGRRRYRMLVRSVLEEHHDEFKLFRQAASKRGFTEQIGDLLKEFSRYLVDFQAMDNLHHQLQAVNAPRTLIDKAVISLCCWLKSKKNLGLLM